MKILLVEDDQIDRKQMERLLKASGLSFALIAHADSLHTCLDLLRHADFEAVLVDLNLPDTSGLDTLVQIHQAHPGVPLIVVAGEGGGGLGLEAVARGAQDYLVKGEFGADLLARTIRYSCERKRAEQAVREANQRLEKVNRELKEMQAQIVQSEKMASIGQLAAGVAHEMNTPVGFVASNFQTLQKYMTRLLDLLHLYEGLGEAVEEGQKGQRLEIFQQIKQVRKDLKIDFLLDDIGSLFEESKEGLHRVAEIIQSLRDFSRIDQAEELGEFNIKEGLRATLEVARNEIKECAEVHLDMGEVPPIVCRAAQVNQVFLNVLVNAAQAIRSQERSEKGTISIRTFAEGDSLICQIADDGPGIPPENLSKVFDPFFTTKPVGSGTGLGLSIAYDIVVNKHNGKIEVDSVVGQGATITITLPVRQAQARQSEPISAEG